MLTSFALLTGCKSTIKATATYISEQKAIDMALELAASSRPEISGAQVVPSNISAKQMTLNEALKRINKGDAVPDSYDPQLPVWFVTMDGLWLGEMSVPGAALTPQPAPYHHFAVIMDAQTGLEIEDSISP